MIFYLLIGIAVLQACFGTNVDLSPIKKLKNEDLLCYQPKPPAEVWVCYNKNIYPLENEEEPPTTQDNRPDSVHVEWKISDGDEEFNDHVTLKDVKRDFNERISQVKPIDQYVIIRNILRKMKSLKRKHESTRVKKRPFDSISYGSVFGGFG